MSNTPHATASIVQVLSIVFHDIVGSYDKYKLYDQVYKSYKSEKITDNVQRRGIKGLLLFCNLDRKRLLYEGKICVPRESVSKALKVVHDAKIARHFGFSKLCQRVTCFTGNICHHMGKQC